MSASVLTFTVPGKPTPQGSKRHVGNGILLESSKELGPWRERVALAAHNAMLKAGWTPFVKTAVALDLTFVMPRPVSTPMRTPPAIKRPDLDKLARGILDAMTHVCFDDDSAVVDLHLHKRIALVAETPGVVIELKEARP